MTLYRAFLWTWIGGLVLFAIVIGMSLPLTLTAVPGGLVDHQAAGTAAEVDRIQMAWSAAGLLGQARIAMLADLVFIGVYGIGAVLGGLYFRRSGIVFLGTGIALAGVLFLVTDYAETLSEIVQLFRFAGDDGLAGLAATARPIKLVVWVVTFVGMLLAFALTRKSARRA